ncbi:bifunctional folylpolyglutamate synthase/dihydrofolate synthase [Limibaculum sp. FT325]|uniref:bifunctional folylpolyglutamate synthase/dihydrofolate synthase n=1 Tax=Thermohalobaculum sediminis TaxID=2939436 RepID=UPI0020BF91F1|nr:folylpolyglutamate synthase/dihydrofolate synthase family protein [Limibaculum sediminis]MCL5776594.1 bifunctional folylpolyglutamate synthase/dihydrofolate synthase [Limibaculum sediminis]
MRDTVPSDAILERLLSLHPKVIDLTLDRVERLLARLGHPERAVPPVVHVAGTNGKGSTIAMIRAGLEAAGERVHVYTSPHLARFHERIRVAGRLIEEPALAALLEECEQVNGAEPITFFEITTAAAFLAFARAPADRLLLEVGLGGRLDATNVIARPALTVITPVSIDHQQYLGETLAEIAGEKAGILKPGVPCVVGPQPDAARAVIEARAAAVGAPLSIHGQDWMARAERGRLVFEDGAGLLDLDLPNLPGPHQIDNAGAALAALRQLGHDEAACAAAVSRAEWPARMQRLKSGPLVARLPAGVELWLDGGHNASAGEAIAAVLDAMAAKGSPPVPVHLVVGMIDTKAAEDFLRPLAGRVGRVATVTIPATPAAIPAGRLAERARSAGHDAIAAESLHAALDHVLAAHDGTTGAPARVLICGSLYLAGQVLTENG